VAADHRYAKLLTEIENIEHLAETGTRTGLNQAIVLSRWKIGERIQETLFGGAKRAARETSAMSKLARDLTRKFGRGFGRRSLNDMRRFYDKYRQKDLNFKLTWTHYRLLLDIADDEERRRIEKRTIAAHSTVWVLRNIVRRYNEREGRASPFSGKLPAPTGSFYLFAVSKGSFGTYIDLGFGIYHRLETPQARKLKDGMIVEGLAGKRGWTLKPRDAGPHERYMYRARLDRVIDGDTVSVYIDAGMGIETKQKLRLRYIDAPELNTSRGRKVKEWLTRYLRRCPVLVFKTHKSDKYSRYLADILCLSGTRNAGEALERGVYLNQEMLNRGLCEYTPG
jgi:endonuclease YncB( thermonuclease family)